MDGDAIIYHSKKRLLLFALGALAFVLLGFWIAWLSEEESIGQLIGWSSIAFFGFCLAYLVFRFVKPAPALVIGTRGIFDSASGASSGLIAWREITDVRPIHFRGQTFLGIYVLEPEAVIRRQPILKQLILRANSALVGTPVTIPVSLLSVKLAELEALISARRPVG